MHINYAVIPQCMEILSLCVVSPVSQNVPVYGQYLNDFLILSWLGNMLYSYTPLIVAIITVGFRI